MMLRYIHAIATKAASNYGPFELRVTKSQLKASLALYFIFTKAEDNTVNPKADMAIHSLLEALLCATGLDDRAINCPTDQVLFLWTCLSDRTYRIPSHVQSFLSAAKYCLRCIALQVANFQVTENYLSPLLEGTIPLSSTQEVDPEGSGNSSQTGNDIACEEGEPLDVAPVNIDSTLEWLSALLSSGNKGNQGTLTSKYNWNTIIIIIKFLQNLIHRRHPRYIRTMKSVNRLLRRAQIFMSESDCLHCILYTYVNIAL